MSIASMIASAKSSYNSKYFEPGDYICTLSDVKTQKNRQDRPMVIIETEIVESGNPTGHPVGSSATQVYMMDSDAGPGNVRSAIRDILGVPDATLDGEAGATAIERCLTPDPDTGKSPLAGIRVRVNAINKITRAGNDFTLVTFRRAADSEHLSLGVPIPSSPVAAASAE